jgi:pyruvate/2-oxoglutarate dehydrogenase complex dihydrolipoamide dehydrogenase (E3) component
MNRFDVIVIGSGQGGVPFATRAAAAGRKTLLVERAQLGGTCVNWGCTPTKTMIASARAAHVARSAARLGVHTGDVQVNLGAVVDRKNRVVQQWRDSIVRRLDRAGPNLTMASGHARFTAARELEIDGSKYAADLIVINVGARPAVPPLPGLKDVRYLDSSSIMELRDVPAHLLVLGGGYVGCEFAQLFRRFGAAVTMVERGAHLLDREDEDVSVALEEVLETEGIDLRLGRQVSRIERSTASIEVRLDDDSTIGCTHLLVAVGRTPNTQDLGCDEGGIRLDAHGFIVVDDHYATSAAGVYAIGDVTGGPQFTHTSWDDHRILYDLVINRGTGSRTRADRLVPYTVFTDPQVARVGLSEREAKQRGVSYEVATMPFGHIARAIELDERAGILKVLIDPETERVLGAAIVGLEAGELIHVFVALMRAGAPARSLVDAEMVHPTLAEGLQTMLMRLERYTLQPARHS